MADEERNEVEEGGLLAPREALALVYEQLEDPPFEVDRIIIRLLATGEVPWRAYERDGIEYEGGVASQP